MVSFDCLILCDRPAEAFGGDLAEYIAHENETVKTIACKEGLDAHALLITNKHRCPLQ